MADRYTKKDAERAFALLADRLDKPVGHYREIAPGEVSNMGEDRRITTIPGGWVLDYAPMYGGVVVEELSPTPGETWVRHPLGETRRSPREFCAMVNFALAVLRVAREEVSR